MIENGSEDRPNIESARGNGALDGNATEENGRGKGMNTQFASSKFANALRETNSQKLVNSDQVIINSSKNPAEDRIYDIKMRPMSRLSTSTRPTYMIRPISHKSLRIYSSKGTIQK